MATSNTTLTSTWSQIASTTDSDLLVTLSVPATVEIATTTANSAPTVNGHLINSNEIITRSLLGSGYVWGRLIPGTVPATIPIVVSK